MNKRKEKSPLWEEIREFRQNKLAIAFVLILLAHLGWIIPIIPGFILLLLALALFKKGWMTKIRRRWRLWRIKKSRK